MSIAIADEGPHEVEPLRDSYSAPKARPPGRATRQACSGLILLAVVSFCASELFPSRKFFSDALLVGACLAYSFLLLRRNLSLPYVLRVCKSYPFVVCTTVLTLTITLDLTSGQSGVYAIVVLITVVAALLHLSGRVVDKPLAVFIVVAMPSAMAAYVAAQTLIGTEKEFFNVGTACFTSLSVRRSGVIAIITTLLLTLVQNAQSGAKHACLTLGVHALHRDLIASVELGASPLALSRVRLALRMRRARHPQGHFSAKSSGGHNVPSPTVLGRSTCVGTSWCSQLSLAAPVQEGATLSHMHALAWHACERLVEVDTKAIALGRWQERQTYDIVVPTALVVAGYISATFVSGWYKIAISLMSLMCFPIPVYLLLHGNLNWSLARALYRSTTSYVIFGWTTVITACNIFRVYLFLQADRLDQAIDTAAFIVVYVIFIAALVVHPAMVARAPRLEGAIAALGFLTQVKSIAVTLSPPVNYHLVTLPTGHAISLSDVRRTGYLQALLCLLRIALVSVKQATRHAQERLDSADAFLNSSFVVPLPLESELDDFALAAVRDFAAAVSAQQGRRSGLELVLPNWKHFIGPDYSPRVQGQ